MMITTESDTSCLSVLIDTMNIVLSENNCIINESIMCVQIFMTINYDSLKADPKLIELFTFYRSGIRNLFLGTRKWMRMTEAKSMVRCNAT